MPKRTVAAALTAGALFAGVASTPATGAPAGQVQDVSTRVVSAFYEQSRSEQRNLCRIWKAQPVKFGRVLVRTMVRIGYARKPASRGVVRGMITVCGAPHGYGGI